MDLYGQLFNPQYVNPQYYETIRNTAQDYEMQQQKEIMNAVHAIHDFMEAANKLDPQHRQMAFAPILAEILRGWQF